MIYVVIVLGSEDVRSECVRDTVKVGVVRRIVHEFKILEIGV